MVLVFDDICMLEDWLTTIRKAIETASGIPYLLGLVSQSMQAERSWLDVVAMPFKPPPSTTSSGRDTACPSRASTSTSLSSPREGEWNASASQAFSGSRSSVYTNAELDDMSQSRSSSYSSAQASSQTSLGHPDEVALRQYKSTPSLVQEADAGELICQQDAAPQTLGLHTTAAPPDIRTQSVSCSPSIHIPPSERTPTLAPEAVYLETGSRLLGDVWHSPHESDGSVRAATMESWLDNAKVEALNPGLDRGIAESSTPSSAIFKDFGFAWDENQVASAEDSQQDSGRRYDSSPTIHVVLNGERDVHARSVDAVRSWQQIFGPFLDSAAIFESGTGTDCVVRLVSANAMAAASCLQRTAQEAPKDIANFCFSCRSFGRATTTGAPAPAPRRSKGTRSKAGQFFDATIPDQQTQRACTFASR
ncbi:hypothetical protein DV735_g577, partial [Chaetothyriales sp. CBS 134920]